MACATSKNATSHNPSYRTMCLVAFCCLAVAASAVSADLVVMKDGRKIEGQILVRDEKMVEIDTVMPSCRAVLHLPTADILTIESKPLPANYFDANRLSAPTPASRPARGGTMYLEVPITGKFGQDVVVEGVRNALAHADVNRIRHVVFVMDSTGHYGLGDALEIYGVMLKYRGKIQFHAMVKNCLGDALVIASLCNTIHMMPGGKIGGSREPAVTALSPEDVAVLRSQLGELMYQTAVGRPGKEQLLKAMIDPAYPLAVWRDSAGKLDIAASAPAAVPAEQVVFASAKGEPLVLTAEQVSLLGNPTFRGTAEDLGKVLNIADWRSSGDYGETVMRIAADARRQRLADLQGKFEERVRENISMRDSLERSLERYIRQAATFDPTDNSYDALLARWDSGLVVAGEAARPGEKSQTTPGSWDYRADGALQYLRMAAQTALVMERLEKEAVQLGIVADYPPGELAKMLVAMAKNAQNLKAQKESRQTSK